MPLTSLNRSKRNRDASGKLRALWLRYVEPPCWSEGQPTFWIVALNGSQTRRTKRGERSEPPIERLYFEDLATMLKVTGASPT